MSQTPPTKQQDKQTFFHGIERSALWTILAVIFLFSFAVIVVLIAPNQVDVTWTSPSSAYQVQMYEVVDPNYYISHASTEGVELDYVHHLKQGYTLLAFKEEGNIRLTAPKELEKYITRIGDPQLKLTSRLLLLRSPEEEVKEVSDKEPAAHTILELYDPGLEEAFAYDTSGGIIQDWVDADFKIVDEEKKSPYHFEYGVVYVKNPEEFRVEMGADGAFGGWFYDPAGKAIKDLKELTSPSMGFYSRKELIALGESTYATEGCWYCHTDQTRTLIEDVVLNGTASYPAPPSSANEFIYQKITFPGTRRIGPDLSRVGVKRASRDWHKMHFWSPKQVVEGSMMPSFRHFFGTQAPEGEQKIAPIPTVRFEAIYQYMMTKGTRITSPNQAWWIGKDPIKTKEIIEGQRKEP